MYNKTGVMIVGLNGEVATCATGGTVAIKKGLVQPLGLVTELDEFKDWNLPEISSLIFSGWDLRCQSHIGWVRKHNKIPESIISSIEDELNDIPVYPAPTLGVSSTILSIDDIDSDRQCHNRREVVAELTRDISDFKKRFQLENVVVVNLSSVDTDLVEQECFQSIDLFEKALTSNDESISTGMLYAYAAISSKCPFINFTPNVTFDIPALLELAQLEGVPLVGKDAKTGQTLYKTVLAPMFRWRNLKVDGWYSTNILGNDDGRVLDDPNHGIAKIKTKSNVLSQILNYDDFEHQVHIHYYPPRGDEKEAWDTIDFRGWLNQSMSVKVNWIGNDSILASPLVIDLIRFVIHAHQNGEKGVIKYLSSFFKSPVGVIEHDFFKQISFLLNKTTYDLECKKEKDHV
ncbi:inositol-3-phosphate synthase [Bacillus velezensis]|uniref:inositol-3-phosphate synthase n=1 Tax=Bacillus velezensis TaxID=492670 RepID=UPI000DC473A3|nr:inositol-3-phosphate synthase [Bacillus velezensis]MED3509501.1 inositol-3-phosphate synthase [Bacillus velezensis]RAP15257.1 Inositol-1-phosphate synthase [Bacillus velezensis]